MKLYINGQLVDLNPDNVIAQTKQVNDLNNIEHRNCNYTYQFKVPKTAGNMRVFQFLTVTGNTSLAPYQKNECSLFSQTGECFIYKGWAMVTDEGNDYKVSLHDGVIDLYKAIENKSLSTLGLSDLSHSKDVPSVIATWEENLPYRYILADYNGNTGSTNTGQVNIDFLVPSVNVAWLWGRIFQSLGFTYSGAVFNTPNFKNLWMTYPKGISVTGENDHLVFASDDYRYRSISPGGNIVANQHYYARILSTDTNELAQIDNEIHMKFADTATYRVEVRGRLFGRKFSESGSEIRNARIRIGKNTEGQGSNEIDDYDVPNAFVFDGVDTAINITHDTEFEVMTQPIALNAFDSLSIVIEATPDPLPGGELFYLDNPGLNRLDVKVYRIDPNEVNFETLLTDFSIRDFMTEVVQRFGLTMYKNKYEPDYKFLTLQEVLQTADVIDWSDKFSRKINENYIYGSYAQQNWLRYNYNDKESTYKDHYIDVQNVNLPETKDVIKSKIYAPEKETVTFLNRETNVYKLWDKEIVEDTDPGEEAIKYKSLDKRYYFMRCYGETKPITVESFELAQSQAASFYYRETFQKLSFDEIIKDYYLPLKQILDRSTIVNTEVWLTDTDIVNFDFKKLYYIKQLSNYYIVNKINNYISGRVTKCEMIRVLYAPLGIVEPQITITGVTTSSYFAIFRITVLFLTDYDAGPLKLQISNDNVTWSTTIGENIFSPFTTSVSTFPDGTYWLRIYDEVYNVYSNVISFVK